MGTGIRPFLGWENGNYCTETGIQPVGMGWTSSKMGMRSLTLFFGIKN